jgi:hypothetical protein
MLCKCQARLAFFVSFFAFSSAVCLSSFTVLFVSMGMISVGMGINMKLGPLFMIIAFFACILSSFGSYRRLCESMETRVIFFH